MIGSTQHQKQTQILNILLSSIYFKINIDYPLINKILLKFDYAPSFSIFSEYSFTKPGG